ncbi:MAG: biotin transporter BioY [Lachnospiraceae bacterium]|nr:biotin transporter BioY [Lachnospiraceae bacterium]
MTTGTKTESGRTGMKTIDMVYIAVFAALMAVCSWISIPTTVPFTLQTFGVFMAVGILGGKRGTLAVLVYILLGAIGLPVFAGFSGGIGALLGTSGGYIVGFLFSALTMWLMENTLGRSTIVQIVSMVIGLIVCYAFGTVWFMAVYTSQTGAVGLMTVLGWCIFPFVIPDLVKIALAFLLSNRLRKYAV